MVTTWSKLPAVTTPGAAPGRRWSTVMWGAVPVALLAGLLSVDHVPGTDISLAVPYAAEGPGPMFNTLGEVSGEPVVLIDGAETNPTSGSLNMTTVSVRTNMTLAQAFGRWIATSDTIVPVEQVLPPNLSEEELKDYNTQAFVSSEASATVAAMRYLGLPTEVVVHDVVEDGPAAGRLEAGDIITAIGGGAVTEPGQVQEIVRGMHPGDTAEVTVRRGGEERKESVVLGENPEKEGQALLGIYMSSEPADGTRVDFNLNDIGGPSAGMIFALAVIDKLTPDELTGGHNVAGTGTIAEDGRVGPIGGIQHKIAGARDAGVELFLAPADNCDEVAKVKTGSMQVAKVASLDDAVRAMEDFSAGRDVAGCSPS